MLSGSDILSLVTSGMYNNPLVIYREYLQNAADAIATYNSIEVGRVEIDLDPVGLSIRIRDYGTGLSLSSALKVLLPVARSEKQRGIERGFRGIGRLVGLAFARTVTFTTRTQGDQRVTRIVWDKEKLDRSIAVYPQTDGAIRECVTVERLSGADWPTHFFQVDVCGIARHAAGLILNRDAVRAHIGEVCPVPIDSQFPFTAEIEHLFKGNEAPLTLDVFVNGDSSSVKRRFEKSIRFSDGREDYYTDFEKIYIPDIDGIDCTAIGWVAHSSYYGILPKSAGIRGIRVRVGNIQIGDESVFDHIFTEDRFNRWCVGELHIFEPRMFPNGRRDYFEPGPHLRNLENHLYSIFAGISSRCRKASEARNQNRRLLSEVNEIQESYDLVASGYLATEDTNKLINQLLNRTKDIRQKIDLTNGFSRTDLDRLATAEMELINLRDRDTCHPDGRIPPAEIATYQKVFKAITDLTRSSHEAKELIESILKYT